MIEIREEMKRWSKERERESVTYIQIIIVGAMLIVIGAIIVTGIRFIAKFAVAHVRILIGKVEISKHTFLPLLLLLLSYLH